MPLPQQVINQLAREPAKTPGWFSSVVLFAGGLLVLALAVYFGMAFAYEPYLAGNVADAKDRIAKLTQSISSGDVANLTAYYSQITNLRSLLDQHVAFSRFFTWLEKNTQSNAYFSQLISTAGNQIRLTGNARTQADLIQQIAIFESSPQVQRVTVSNVEVSGVSGLWQFTAALIMDPSVFAPPLFEPSAPGASTPSSP